MRKQFKRQTSSSVDSIANIKSVQNRLDIVTGKWDSQWIKKLANVLEKNNGFSILQMVSNI